MLGVRPHWRAKVPIWEAYDRPTGPLLLVVTVFVCVRASVEAGRRIRPRAAGSVTRARLFASLLLVSHLSVLGDPSDSNVKQFVAETNQEDKTS